MQIPTNPYATVRDVQSRMRRVPGRWWWARGLEFGVLVLCLIISRELVTDGWKMFPGDVTEYHRYALAFWLGSGNNPPMHSFPAEYPPLAIAVFSLTLLPPIPDFPDTFGIWMGLLFLAGYVGFMRYSSHRRAVTYALYLFVGALAVVIQRFDLVPAMVTLAALWLAQRRRFGYAYLCIAIGVLLKLYPAFLLPVVMIEHYHVMVIQRRPNGGMSPAVRAASRWVRRGKPWHALRVVWQDYPIRRVTLGTLFCVGVILVGFFGPLALNPAGAISGFVYAGDRPLQIESMPASVLWLGTLFGIPAHPDYSFVSLNFVGPLDVVLKPLSALALLCGCLLVYWRQARGKLTMGQAFVACLAAVIVTNKIFSPQYLIWLMPVVAEVDGFDWLWLAVCALTTLDFPIIYQMKHPITAVPYTSAFLPEVALRNFLLLFVTVRAIFRQPVAVPVETPRWIAPEPDEAEMGGEDEVDIPVFMPDDSGVEPVLAH